MLQLALRALTVCNHCPRVPSSSTIPQVVPLDLQEFPNVRITTRNFVSSVVSLCVVIGCSTNALRSEQRKVTLRLVDVREVAPQDGQPLFFAAMGSAFLGDTLYVAGHGYEPAILGTPRGGGAPVPGFLGLRIVPGENPLKLPAPEFQFREFMYPVLGVSSDGSVHMFWSEEEVSRRGARSDSSSGRMTSIWYSMFRRGNWSKPRVILTERSGTWIPSNVSSVVSVGGSVQFAMPSRSDSIRAFKRVVADSSGVQVLQIPGAVPTAVPSVSLAGFDKVLIAVFVRSVLSRESAAGGRQTEVVQIRSHDGGKTWMEPQVIHRSPGRIFQEVDIAFARDSSLHVLVRQVVSDTSIVSHLRSRDLGGTWTTGVQLRRGGRLQDADILIGPCGDLFAQFEDWSGATPVPVFFKFDSLSTTQVPLTLADDSEQTAMLEAVADSRGNVRLAWTDSRDKQGSTADKSRIIARVMRNWRVVTVTTIYADRS